MNSPTPWKLQPLATEHHGYAAWHTFAVRDSRNHCIAVVGAVDRATAPHNAANGQLMKAAPELLAICEEIAADSRCDLVTSERRMRLYHAIRAAGGSLA